MILSCLLDIFKFDPNYLENEERYKEIKNEILGEDSDDDDSEESSGDSEEDERECYFCIVWNTN